MRKYYTRPCNFYYGNYSKNLVKKKKAFPLAGNPEISFDSLEIFKRQNKGKTQSYIYLVSEIEKLGQDLKIIIKNDLKKITSKRKNIFGVAFNKPKIIGVLNVTPDSFSDGGLYLKKSRAYKHAMEMNKNGAAIIDIGGESTRPGSEVIHEVNEWNRIKHVIKEIKKKNPEIKISLDTRKSYVMEKGIEYGANFINDISGLTFDKNSFDLIKSKNIPFILHHSKGTPDIMQKKPSYNDAILDVFDFFEEKIKFCIINKYKKELIITDPGIGFGKNLSHNLRIMSKISLFHSLGCPILIGTSRKKFIKHIVTKFDTPKRLGGTLASVLNGLSQGVQLFRVHDVKEINQGILVFKKILDLN